VNECKLRRGGSNDETFEIHRFFVSQSARKRGIGTSLLRAIETFLESTTRSKYGLVATTPSILSEANAFYKSSGFQLQDAEEMKGLVMNTYGKRVNNKDNY